MSDQHSGCWIKHASFKDDGNGTYHSLSKREFIDNLKMRMGCNLFPNSKPRKCNCLEDLTFMVDENHYHGISCPKGAAIRSNNHTQSAQILRKFMEKVLGPGAQAREGECQFEEDELLPRLDRPNNVDIRADIRIYFNGTVRYIDLGITSPATKTTKILGAVTKLAAADRYAKSKIIKYKKYLNEESMKYFIPFIFETTGSMGAHAIDFIRTIKNNKHRLITNGQYKDIYKRFRQEQIILFAKNNSRLLQLGYDNQIILEEIENN